MLHDHRADGSTGSPGSGGADGAPLLPAAREAGPGFRLIQVRVSVFFRRVVVRSFFSELVVSCVLRQHPSDSQAIFPPLGSPHPLRGLTCTLRCRNVLLRSLVAVRHA